MRGLTVRTAVIGAALVTSGLGAAACGSSTPSAAPTTSSGATSSSSTSTPAVVGPPLVTTTTAAAVPFKPTGNFCADLKNLQDAPPAQSNDPAGAFRTIDQLKTEAPPQLRDVFDLITAAITQLGTTDATDQVAVERAINALQDPTFQSGMQRLGDYAKSTCGFELSGTGPNS